MENSVEAKVKALVTDFKLDEALEILITQAQSQNQRKQNILLVLKGKLTMLEEQNFSGILEPSEVARQRAVIAHQILDIADGSALDYDHPLSKETEQLILVQKTIAAPASTGTNRTKYLLMAALLVAGVLVGIFIAKSSSDDTAEEQQPVNPNTEQPTDVAQTDATTQSGGPVKVLNFPNLQQPFNFLDFGFEFRWADAEWISDSEIRLKIRAYLTCKSNLGNCYCATVRIYADDRPIAPAEQSNLAGWVAHNATITDDLSFVLPADAKKFHIELARDKSTWKRPFTILK